MRYIIYVILIGAILGITFGLFGVFNLRGFVPNLILLTVIALSLVFDNFDYLFFGLIGGFWLDIVYGLPVGSFTIPLTLCGAVGNFFLKQWFFSEVQWYHFMGAIIAATVFVEFWLWGYTNLLVLFHWNVLAIAGKQIFSSLWMAVLVNIVFSYPVYIVVEMFARSQLRWQKNKLQI